MAVPLRQYLESKMSPLKVPSSMEEAILPVPDPTHDKTLPDRIREVYVMFDNDNNGFLTMDELSKLLRKLGGFSNDEIGDFCTSIDTGKDGKVSYKELVLWIQKGGGPSGEQVAQAIIRETNKRAVRIKEVFDRYDSSSDGNLGLGELQKVLRTLGAFTMHELTNVMKDVDTNGDYQISFAEFADWVRRPCVIKEVIKAKCILAPSDSDGIESVFYTFCGANHADIDGKSFLKLVKDCNLLNKCLTVTDVDLIFSDNRVKPKAQRRIDFSQFEVALELVAEKRGSSVEVVRNALQTVTHPILKGTTTDYVRFHDDHTVGASGASCKDDKDGRSVVSTPRSVLSTPRRAKKHRMPGALPSGIRTDPLAVSVDNTNVWKAFDIETGAGRSLKRLYSRPCAKNIYKGFVASVPPSMGTYVAVNLMEKKATTYGVRFRRSMDESDFCPDPLDVIPWGASVTADLVAPSWLRVGNRFLPTSVKGIPVMHKWTGPGAPPNPSSSKFDVKELMCSPGMYRFVLSRFL